LLEFKNRNELEQYFKDTIVTSVEAAEILDITSTALTSLMLRGKLTPIMERGRTRLFWREDVEKRQVDAVALREKYAPKKK